MARNTTVTDTWTLQFDGGSRGNPGPAGAGVTIVDATGQPIFEAGFFLGRMTNNQAEYSGLLRGLEAAQRLGGRRIAIYADSELVVRQIMGQYRVRNEGLKPLFEQAEDLLATFEAWTIAHVPRLQNARADELGNMAMDAKRDVVPGRTAAATETAGSQGVIAECVTGSGGGCGMRRGSRFHFEDVVPEGLCVYAGAAMLDLVAAMLDAQRDSQAEIEPVNVQCPRDGCRAKFVLRPAD